MINGLFVLLLGLILAVFLGWAFKTLPNEKWQILASVPIAKKDGGKWEGLNLTYYGLFYAHGMVIAVAIWLILLTAVSVPIIGIAAIASFLLVIALLSSRIIARWVEKKPHTATVGGASFAIVLLAPWLLILAREPLGARLGFDIPLLSVLAAIGISYAFGEGIGRLACISFGCCYGKPLAESPLFQKLFAKWNFIFTGKTKKIAYAHGLDGKEVIPIQAITSVIYTATGLLGTILFLKGFYGPAFIMTAAVTQIWRVVSEFFRADYRGAGRISAYQKMAILSIPYSLALVFLLPEHSMPPADVLNGLRILLSPWVILFLQLLWVAVFLYTGRSMVTGSTISFHVFRDRI
jgi:prolipoprotein diacylglyceryltransferase